MKKWKYILGLLSLATISIWLAVVRYPGRNLQIIACDVGQGDAILIQQGHSQILIDGGPNSKAIDCLDQYITFWDKKIEIVILTHPQKDHYGGLIDVFEKYEVETMLTSGLDASSREYQVLENLVGGVNTKILYAGSTQVVRLGLMRLDILHPSEDFILANSNLKQPEGKKVLGTFMSDDDPNEFSVVGLLTYRDFNALLTGDIDKNISDLISEGLQSNDIEYLKVPHHGSKNGLTDQLLAVNNFKVAVISAGKNNSYGHPHQEILKILRDRGIKILRTDEVGDVIVETDGDKFWID